jgi:hypothetical protein
MTKIRYGCILTSSCLLVALAASADAATFDYIDLSGYANNNIYTDLNQNFPNTGPGVPGTHIGTANAVFTFSPWSYVPPAAAVSGVPYSSYSAPLGNNGVSFQLHSNTAGQDFVQIGNPGGGAYTGANPLSVTIGATDVTTVYALMASYTGQSFSVTFNGTGGSQTFSNISLPDFNGGGPINTCGGGVCDQTVYTVTDVGGGSTGNSATGQSNTYDLTEVAFTLDSSLAAGGLTSATFTSNGYETLLFGLTTASPEIPTGAPGPIAGAGLPGVLAMLMGGLMWWRRKLTFSPMPG